jgi:hypothetical protein
LPITESERIQNKRKNTGAKQTRTKTLNQISLFTFKRKFLKISGYNNNNTTTTQTTTTTQQQHKQQQQHNNNNTTTTTTTT